MKPHQASEDSAQVNPWRYGTLQGKQPSRSCWGQTSGWLIVLGNQAETVTLFSTRCPLSLPGLHLPGKEGLLGGGLIVPAVSQYSAHLIFRAPPPSPPRSQKHALHSAGKCLVYC